MELRPWPRSYHLANDTFELNDTYYFGIRIKKNDTGS